MACTRPKYQLGQPTALVGTQRVAINILTLREEYCIDIYCTDYNTNKLQHPKDKPANCFGCESTRTTKLLWLRRLVGVLEPAGIWAIKCYECKGNSENGEHSGGKKLGDDWIMVAQIRVCGGYEHLWDREEWQRQPAVMKSQWRAKGLFMD